MPLPVHDLAVSVSFFAAVSARAVVHIDSLTHVAEIQALVAAACPVLIADNGTFLMIVRRAV